MRSAQGLPPCLKRFSPRGERGFATPPGNVTAAFVFHAARERGSLPAEKRERDLPSVGLPAPRERGFAPLLGNVTAACVFYAARSGLRYPPRSRSVRNSAQKQKKQKQKMLKFTEKT